MRSGNPTEGRGLFAVRTTLDGGRSNVVVYVYVHVPLATPRRERSLRPPIVRAPRDTAICCATLHVRLGRAGLRAQHAAHRTFRVHVTDENVHAL